jgi:hypothetical protein
VKYTIQDLAYSKGTSEPVRQALFLLEEKLTEAQTLLSQIEKSDLGLAWKSEIQQVLK